MLSNVSLQAKTEQIYVYLFFLKSLRFTTERVFNHVKAFRDACFGFVGHINDLSFFFFFLCMYRSILIRSTNIQGAFWICSGCVPVPLDLWFAHK